MFRQVAMGVKAPQDGFTLVEVMVSMIIISTAAVSMLVLISQGARSLSTIEDRFLASLVADNVLVEAMATPRVTERISTQGTAPMGATEWQWQLDKTSTQINGFVQLKVSVKRPEGEDVFSQISAYRLGIIE